MKELCESSAEEPLGSSRVTNVLHYQVCGSASLHCDWCAYSNLCFAAPTLSVHLSCKQVQFPWGDEQFPPPRCFSVPLGVLLQYSFNDIHDCAAMLEASGRPPLSFHILICPSSFKLIALQVILTDTAGLREPEDPVEQEGMARALRAARSAHVIVLVWDATDPSKQQANAGRMLATLLAQSDVPFWGDLLQFGKGDRPGYGDSREVAVGSVKQLLSQQGTGIHGCGGPDEGARKKSQGGLALVDLETPQNTGGSGRDGEEVGLAEQEGISKRAGARALGFESRERQEGANSVSFGYKPAGGSDMYEERVWNPQWGASHKGASGKGFDKSTVCGEEYATGPGGDESPFLNRLDCMHQNLDRLLSSTDSAVTSSPGEQKGPCSGGDIPWSIYPSRQSRQNTPPLLVLFNKCDLVGSKGMEDGHVGGGKMEGSGGRKQGFGGAPEELTSFFRVSCKTGEGLDDVAQFLTDIARHLSGHNTTSEHVTIITRYALRNDLTLFKSGIKICTHPCLNHL
jgi:hypothetical protein